MQNKETKESLLADFESKDSHRIWSASWAVIKTRDVEVLAYLGEKSDLIIASTNGIELGGMISPNADTLKFALHKLDYFKKDAGCLCKLYLELLAFDPEKEEKAGHVIIVSKKEIPYASEFVCECTDCKTRYNVVEGEYHFAFWTWTC